MTLCAASRSAALVITGRALDRADARELLEMCGLLDGDPLREVQAPVVPQQMRTARHRGGGRMAGSSDRVQLHGHGFADPYKLLGKRERKRYVYGQSSGSDAEAVAEPAAPELPPPGLQRSGA